MAESRLRQFSRTVVFGYAVSLLVTAAALLVRWFFDPYLGNNVPYITLYAAVAFLAIFVGFGPAVSSALLGLAGVTYLWVPPRDSWALANPKEAIVASILCLLVCGAIIAAGEMARRSQIALERTRNLFEAFIENSPGAEYLKDEAGRYVYCNKTIRDRFTPEYQGRTDLEIFPATARQYREHDSQVLQENKARQFIETSQEEDGEHTWFTVKFPVVGPDGRRMVGGKSIDITEQKRAEEEVAHLQREKERNAAAELEAMMHLQAVGAVCIRTGDRPHDALHAILDTAILLTEVDKGNVQLFDSGKGVLRIVAQRGFEGPFLDFFSEVREAASACSSALRSAERVIVEDVTTSEIFAGTPSLEVLRASGVRAVQSTPLLSSSGEVMGVISTHHERPHNPGERELRLMDLLARLAADYLERKQTEQALEAASTRLQRFLAAAPTGLTRCSRDLRYLDANPAYAAIAGLPVEQIVGRPIIDVMGSEAWEKIRPYVERVLCGERVEYESDVPFSAGGSRQLHVVYMPERNNAHEIVGWVASVTDITEFRSVEEQLRKIEKLAAAGQLAASLAHEINNPLSSVANALYVLKCRSDWDHESEALLAIAESELARLSRIVKQSLSYYRVGAVAKKLDLAAVVEESLQVFSEKFRYSGIQVTTRIEPDTSFVGYADEIRQVIDNLLLNSIEAKPNRGRLVVSVRPSSHWNDHGTRGVRLTIADTGCGIPRENLARIFEPFFTTKADKGTGLGLWVIRGIVAKHEGSIRIRSSAVEGNSGTVISILWPLGKTRLTSRLAQAETASSSGDTCGS
jgi:PAS domain S-box-containing protein